MRKPLVAQSPLVAKINVTPIIDVALVLVIILLVTAPMIAVKDLDISPPPAQTHGVDSDARIIVTLGKAGLLAINDESVTQESLIAEIARRLAAPGKENLIVVVRADEGAPYAVVEAIIKDAKLAGAKRLAIATRQRGKVTR